MQQSTPLPSTFQIVLNRTNLLPGTSTFEMPLTQTLALKPQDRVCMTQCSLYNSFFNISNSDQLKITWLGVDHVYTFAPGYYSASDITAQLLDWMTTDGLYVVQSNGKPLSFISLAADAITYTIQLSIYPIPSQAQATASSYTLPVGATWAFPVNPTTPQITFMSVSLAQRIGFVAQQAYPPAPTQTQMVYNSPITPAMSKVSAILATSNVCSNRLSWPPNVLTAIPITSPYGELIQYIDARGQTGYASTSPGSYGSISVSFLDAGTLQPLPMNDFDVCIALSFMLYQ